ncbi:MAG: hypothetical protein HY822_07795 [Acidobacteria bacterium]|nr:hypothetical protein [Acidobacteriota bacterium]
MSQRACAAFFISFLTALEGPPRAGAADILQIRVLEGEGAVHATASRSARPLTVQVTDETGQPVAGAAVSFRLPDEGPAGVFASGMKTEVAITGAGGRASVWGIQWNRTAGPFQVRVTTVKGQNRAGIAISQYLSDAAPDQAATARISAGRGRGKWVYAVLLVAAAGAAASGAAMGLSRESKSAPAPLAADALSAPAVQVGPPTVTIGKP